LIISNRNSFRLLFDKKKLRPYILFAKKEIHLHFSIENGQFAKQQRRAEWCSEENASSVTLTADVRG